MNKKVIITIISLILLASIIFILANRFKKDNPSRNISLVLNSSSESIHYIDLEETLDKGEHVVPGSEGHFVLTLKFPNIKTKTKYTIERDIDSLPPNLKVYTDKERTKILKTITGEYSSDGDESYNYTLYWKWEIEDNAKDNLFQNSSFLLPLIVITEDGKERSDSHEN